MADLLDAYVTDSEYRARVGDKSATSDATLNAQLVAVSRMLERSLGVAAGAFNQTTAPEARVFDAHGGRTLYLRDSAERAHYVRTLATNGIAVDEDGDGIYEVTFDLSAVYVRGIPDGAGYASEPFEGFELLSLEGAPFSWWPKRPASVRVTATFGWPNVPGIVKELTAHLAHDLREGHLAGGVMEIPMIDRGLPLQSDTWRLWNEARRAYSRRMPSVG